MIGDAGHAVVHHFGQGACLAIEDAVCLAASIEQNTRQQANDVYDVEMHRHLASCAVTASLDRFDSWGRWMRTRALVLISRSCGAMYLSNTIMSNAILTFCLAWPFYYIFVVLMRFLLFICGKPLRSLAEQFRPTQTVRTASSGHQQPNMR